MFARKHSKIVNVATIVDRFACFVPSPQRSGGHVTDHFQAKRASTGLRSSHKSRSIQLALPLTTPFVLNPCIHPGNLVFRMPKGLACPSSEKSLGAVYKLGTAAGVASLWAALSVDHISHSCRAVPVACRTFSHSVASYCRAFYPALDKCRVSSAGIHSSGSWIGGWSALERAGVMTRLAIQTASSRQS
jgi:hypothetical protein